MIEKQMIFTNFPADSQRWHDLERLFGPRGACAGCWCMWWRLTRKEFQAGTGESKRQGLLSLVSSGKPVGVIAYHGEEPVGWCALAPREDYPALERSRVLRRVDSQPVWSITCFFIARGYRRKGLMDYLIHAAARYAHSLGAQVLEGYPVDPQKEHYPDTFAYMGFYSAFQRAGFYEAARFGLTRPICRLDLSVA